MASGEAQTKFELDRGAKYDVALAVENFVTKQRNIVSRAKGGAPQLSGALPQPPPQPHPDALQNGMLFRIFTDPWVTFTEKPTAQVGAASEVILDLPGWAPRPGKQWQAPTPTAP